MFLKLVLTIGLLAAIINATENFCKSKNFNADSIVCVCDESYCDSIDPVLPSAGAYLIVTTNKAGLRFATSYGYLRYPNNNVYGNCISLLQKRTAIFDVRKDETAQTILGYGGAFTDAVGLNLNKISPKLVDVFFDSLFTQQGLSYNMARTTIGHCDFSAQEYYYTKEDNDYDMSSWALRDEDYKLRIPYLKRAMSMVPELRLTANIWTVPAWLREEDDAGIDAKIVEERWGSYCLYIMKYLEAYRKQGIDFWTVGYANEPTLTMGAILFPREAQVFTAWAANKLAEFAVQYFGPALKKYGFNDTKIIFLDDNRDLLTHVLLSTILDVDGIRELLEVIGVHSYSNKFISPSVVDMVHEEHPNVTILSTEQSAAQGSGVSLGSWSRAEFYIQNYIEEMNHYSSGWIDWNLALDLESGPRFIGTPVDAAIIIDYEKNVFYKQPSYYAIGHFSKFIPKGSKRINLVSEFATDVQYTAALRPDGLIAAVLFNKSNFTVDVKILERKRELQINLTPNSINTILF